MSKKIKVRFNLGRGKNYMKWKVQYPSGEVEYHSPTDTQLILKNCQLKNNRKTAIKIFEGEHKTVCAWILCEEIELRNTNFKLLENLSRLKYNPKTLPYWVMDDGNVPVDNLHFNEIGTMDYKLFVIKEIN